MVVDTSVILAVFFEEEHGHWAAQQLSAHAGTLSMSTVNLAEALIRLQDRQPARHPEIARELLASGIRFVPPDAAQAQIAAQARLRFPLNLGDCFAYALAVAEETSLLTLDADFRSVDVPILMP